MGPKWKIKYFDPKMGHEIAFIYTYWNYWNNKTEVIIYGRKYDVKIPNLILGISRC